MLRWGTSCCILIGSTAIVSFRANKKWLLQLNFYFFIKLFVSWFSLCVTEKSIVRRNLIVSYVDDSTLMLKFFQKCTNTHTHTFIKRKKVWICFAVADSGGPPCGMSINLIVECLIFWFAVVLFFADHEGNLSVGSLSKQSVFEPSF